MIIPRMIATLIIASMTKMLRGYCTLPRKKLLKYSFLFMAWSIIIVSKFQSFFFDMNMNVISHNIKTYGITTSNIRHVDAESFAEAFWYFTCEKFSVILTVTLSFLQIVNTSSTVALSFWWGCHDAWPRKHYFVKSHGGNSEYDHSFIFIPSFCQSLK